MTRWQPTLKRNTTKTSVLQSKMQLTFLTTTLFLSVTRCGTPPPPMIIYTLFDTVDFSGKTVVPFNTHMGSRDVETYKTVREKARGATAGKRRSGFSHFAVLRGSFLRLRFGTASQVLQSLAHLTSGDGRKSSMAEKRTRIFGWNE